MSTPFDPPESVNCKPDAALLKPYRATIEADSERAAVVAALSADAKLALYAALLRARLHDIQLQRWVRTGVISKAWLGTGEEGTTVGPVHALERGSDVVAPMIRNAAACCELGMPIADMLRAYLATDDSPSRGRDLHVGAWTHGVLPPISHVGDLVPVVAAARCRDGQGPAMLVAETFRMGGHATHDEHEARETLPAEMFQAWGKRDPVGLYEEYLKEEGQTERQLSDVEAAVTAQVERAAEEALASRARMPPGERAT